MHLVLADDFETVKNKYIDVIENTPGIERHARWVYGKHPYDELLQAYMDHGEMYVLKDDDEVAGMVAICMYQCEDYETIAWHDDLPDDQVATLHLLAVCPAYRGRALGSKILEEAMELTVKNGKKALRLDTLGSNLPAQRMYEKAGFSYRGTQKLYAENTGIMDFIYYEKLPEKDSSAEVQYKRATL